MQGKKLLVETVLEEAQPLDLLDADFKSTVLNTLKELKEAMGATSHQIENISEGTEIIKMSQTGFEEDGAGGT